jgi:hypothetical protein
MRIRSQIIIEDKICIGFIVEDWKNKVYVFQPKSSKIKISEYAMYRIWRKLIFFNTKV